MRSVFWLLACLGVSPASWAAVPEVVSTGLSDALVDVSTVAGLGLLIVVWIAFFRWIRLSLDADRRASVGNYSTTGAMHDDLNPNR